MASWVGLGPSLPMFLSLPVACASRAAFSSLATTAVAPSLNGSQRRGLRSSSVCMPQRRWLPDQASAVRVSSRKGRSGVVANSLGDALTAPPIDGDIKELQEVAGAVFGDDDIVETYGNDSAALEAMRNGLAISDQSHFGRIRVADADRIRFLHNQSTADFNRLKPGEGCETVFVTPTARTIDLARAFVQANSVLLVVSPDMRHQLLPMLDKYLFFADKVKLQDVTEQCSMLVLYGPGSHEVITQLQAGDMVGQPKHSHRLYNVNGSPVVVAVGTGLATEGYTLVVDTAVVADLWATLAGFGAVPMGRRAWTHARVLEGRPVPGAELTDEFNPLEAGLWHTISTDKGCYIGQETIARLITYSGTKQYLWGVELESPVEAGTLITVDGEKAGKITSCITLDDGVHRGLAYVRTKVGGSGLQVDAAGVKGVTVDVPYVTRTLPA
eukprot:jgi/Chlat1/7157/Chrsp57S06830